MLRHDPWFHLPGLIAVLLLAATAPARATATMIALCNGGQAELPTAPARRDCDQACHFGCARERKRG